MYKPRKIESNLNWSDRDKIKIYTVSESGEPVDKNKYLIQLERIKKSKTVNWSATPAFVIFHEAVSAYYFVLAWWGNDNELLTHVTVEIGDGWIHDPDKYSFCVWDLEIMWAERNFFIESVYCGKPDIDDYRAKRLR